MAVTLTNEKSVRGVLSSVGQEMLSPSKSGGGSGGDGGITWAKIISLYCVAGGLAVDCVRSGHPEYLMALIDATALVVERDAAAWIAQQGGWVGHYELF